MKNNFIVTVLTKMIPVLKVYNLIIRIRRIYDDRKLFAIIYNICTNDLNELLT